MSDEFKDENIDEIHISEEDIDEVKVYNGDDEQLLSKLISIIGKRDDTVVSKCDGDIIVRTTDLHSVVGTLESILFDIKHEADLVELSLEKLKNE